MRATKQRSLPKAKRVRKNPLDEIVVEARPRCRLSKLGESRVLHPFRMDRAALIGMGATGVQFTEQCFLEGYWKRSSYDFVFAMNAAAYAFNCDFAASIHDAKVMKNIFAEYESKKAGTWPGQDTPMPQANTNWMKDLKVPVILGEAMPEIPNSLELPLDEMFEEFNDQYFTNTSHFMLAFLLLCRVKNVYLFGCDFDYLGMDAKSERGRGGMEYWIGRARGMGTEIHIPPGSMLLETNMRRATGIYGYYMQPLALRDEAGNVVGIKEWVDPVEYRMDTQLSDKVCAKIAELGGDRGKGKWMTDNICKVLGIHPMTLMAFFQDQMEFRAKNGAGNVSVDL